jgi:hypothetical protein
MVDAEHLGDVDDVKTLYDFWEWSAEVLESPSERFVIIDGDDSGQPFIAAEIAEPPLFWLGLGARPFDPDPFDEDAAVPEGPKICRKAFITENIPEIVYDWDAREDRLYTCVTIDHDQVAVDHVLLGELPRIALRWLNFRDKGGAVRTRAQMLEEAPDTAQGLHDWEAGESFPTAPAFAEALRSAVQRGRAQLEWAVVDDVPQRTWN